MGDLTIQIADKLNQNLNISFINLSALYCVCFLIQLDHRVDTNHGRQASLLNAGCDRKP